MPRFSALIGLTLLLSLPVVATAADAESERRAPLTEVERGFHVSSDVGALFYFSVPGEGGSFSSGALIGFGVGYDVLPQLQLGIIGWGQSVGAESDYKGITDTALDTKRARGDFQSLLLGGSARFLFLQLEDENGVERTHFYLRGAAGAALSRPVGVLDENGFFVAGGPGIEYFTRVRHFSIGLEADLLATVVDLGTAVGLSVLPHLTYTF